MQSFPLLFQWSSDPAIYHGFLSVMDRELEICIEINNADSRQLVGGIRPGAMRTSQRILTSNLGCISGTEELKDILSGHEAQLQQKMEEAMDMESFLIELVDTMEAILSSKRMEADQERPVSYWSHIAEQLDALGWSKVTHLSEDLSQAQIELCDASQRRHTLTVRFPPGYPAAPLILEPLEVPECESERPSQISNPGTISSTEGFPLDVVVQQAQQQLELFKDFWDVMQDIDDKTWVIDPDKPTRADRMRRCALGNHCSIQITINPLSPRSKAETRLFGPSASIEPLRIKLYNNSELWDERKLPRENLEVLLELHNGFPSPVSVTKDEMNIECGICYSFRYEGQIPDQLCSNLKCQRPFHHMCLYDWLRTVPTMRQSFNTLFGECPYCNKTITTTVPRT